MICNYSLHTYVGLACAIWLLRMVKTLIGTAISRKKTFYPIIKWKAAKLGLQLLGLQLLKKLAIKLSNGRLPNDPFCCRFELHNPTGLE